MIEVKCIDKQRNKSGDITAYKLIDRQWNIKVLKPLELKQMIKQGQIKVVNLTLTSNNRLIDKSEPVSVDVGAKNRSTPAPNGVKSVDEYRSLIRGKAQADRKAEEVEKARKADECAILKRAIGELAERIQTLITLANACIDEGINLPDKYVTTDISNWGHCSWDFYTDGIYHHVGFVGRRAIRKGDKDKHIDYMGIEMGGACGVYDFYTNGVNTFSMHEDTKAKIEPVAKHMKDFLAEFDTFEKAFYKWLDSFKHRG